MSLNATAVLDALASHAASLGFFDRVNTHEPKNAPGNGLTVAIWADFIGPVRSSGLAQTSAMLRFNLRIYSNMLQEPQDGIDPAVIEATDALLNAYSGDFTLSDPTGTALVRQVDLLGANGMALQAQAGYEEIDSKMFRVMTITLPLVVNDAWSQVA